jgi:hypothetical protein
MKPEIFLITKKEGIGIKDESVIWLHCFSHDEKHLTFWGKIDSKRNIDTIKDQELPFIVEIIGLEENQKYKAKYGTDFSVSEGCKVTVNPTEAQTIRFCLKSGMIDGLLNVVKNSDFGK